MDELDKLAAALVAFQGEVPVIPKNRTAKIPTKAGGSYSYKYADLSDIWDAIRQPLRKNGLAVTQQLCGPVGSAEIGITTTTWHESGQNSRSTIYLSTVGKSPQEVGSLLTYFKRYALSAALGISVDEDDDGAAASSPRQAQPARVSAPPRNAELPQKKPADVKRDQLRDLAKERGWDTAAVADAFSSYALVTNEKPEDIRSASAEDIDAFMVALKAGAVTIE